MPVRSKRSIAWAVVACIALTFALSAFFICTNARHDCVGQRCQICTQIDTCRTIVKEIGFVLVHFAAYGLFFPAIFCALSYILRSHFINDSLLEKKVRLNI